MAGGCLNNISAKTALVVLFVLGALTYSNALNHPFMIDDHAFFDEMDHRWGNLLYQFIPDKSKVLQMEGARTEVYYRPLGVVLPKALYLLFGQKVFFFHLTNLIVFIFSCWVIFLFVRALSGDAFLALLSAAFYLVHPLNGITVNYKTGLGFAVQVMCMAGSLICLLNIQEGRGKREEGRKNKDNNRIKEIKPEQQPFFAVFSSFLFPLSSFFMFFSSLLLFILALFCHESAMMLPFLAVVMFWAIRREKESVLARAWFALRSAAPLWGALGVYFLLRMRFASLQDSIFQKFAGYQMNIIEYLATVAQMGWWYLSRVIAPDGIVISVFFPVERTHAWPWFFVLVLLLGCWALGLYRLRQVPVCVIALWLVAFGFGLLSVGCLFHGNDLMIEPHWFVFPSIGIFICLAYGVGRLARSPLKRYAIAGAVVLILVWGLTARSYNALWDNERNYCFYWLEQSPQFSPVHMYIARSYFTQRRFEQAAYHYKRALTGQYPDHLMYANLGTIAFLQGRMDEAGQYLRRALAIEPRTKVALNTLAIVELKRGRPDEAEKYLKLSIESNRFGIAARWNLAKLYERSGRAKDAQGLYKEILMIDPQHQGARASIKRF